MHGKQQGSAGSQTRSSREWQCPAGPGPSPTSPTLLWCAAAYTPASQRQHRGQCHGHQREHHGQRKAFQHQFRHGVAVGITEAMSPRSSPLIQSVTLPSRLVELTGRQRRRSLEVMHPAPSKSAPHFPAGYPYRAHDEAPASVERWRIV